MPSHGQKEQRRLSKGGCDDFGIHEKRRNSVFVSSDEQEREFDALQAATSPYVWDF